MLLFPAHFCCCMYVLRLRILCVGWGFPTSGFLQAQPGNVRCLGNLGPVYVEVGGPQIGEVPPLNRDRKIVAFISICTTLGGLGEVPKCYGAAAKYVNRQNGGQRACSCDWCDFSFSSSFSSVFPELFLTVVTFNDAISQPTPRDSLFWRALAHKFEL